MLQAMRSLLFRQSHACALIGCIALIPLASVAQAANDCACDTADLSASELAALAAADQAYADAWRTNDPDRVMATLTRDPVIVPSGLDPIAGPDSIRAFWFPPDSPSTTVNSFELVQEEVAGAADLGYARGSFTLSFDYDGKSYESEGTYFTLLRRQGNGDWRIARRTWNDHQRSVSD